MLRPRKPKRPKMGIRPPERKGWHALRFVADVRKVRVTCAACDRPMWLPNSKVDIYRTCGPICRKALNIAKRELRRRECAICNTIFYPRLSQLKIGQGRCCSQKCNGVLKEINITDAAAAARRERLIAARLEAQSSFPRGPAHKLWKGGRKAAQRRSIDSGNKAAGMRAWRKKNPTKVREYSQRRRSLPPLPNGTIKRIAEAQRWRCAICRCKIASGYHVDHIKPLARDGEHIASNVQLLCKSCNLRKSAKDPIDYMRSLGRLL